jgi:hypothetical protein
MLAEELIRHIARLAQKRTDSRGPFRPAQAARRRQHFNPVTGRNNQALADQLAVNERLQTASARFIREGQPLAHLNRRSLMIESDEND